VTSADLRQGSFVTTDGVRLVWHEIGEGRPVVLIHGLFSSAEVNWIKYGHAEWIAELGRRVIMPDLRAHGQSDKPHGPEHYPPDVLSKDALELIAHLGLTDYDLGGYSLGARTALRTVLMAAAPARLVISGMGLGGIVDARSRSAHFERVLTGLGTFERGSPEWMAEAFLKTTKGDPKALLPLLQSFVDTAEAELARITQPTLVLSGAEDHDNGSSEELAARLVDARFIEVPGNHMSVVTTPAFGRAIADFLDA
jgi:pimeloyl-ACP methyl ester carboxylesterase